MLLKKELCMSDLKQKIEMIFSDDKKLEQFVFFFHKIDSKSGWTLEEINIILNRVLLHGDKAMPVRCKFEERALVLLVNTKQIGAICDAVIKSVSLKYPLTKENFEIKYQDKIFSNDKRHSKYKELLSLYRDGDEILEIVSPRKSWKQLCGCFCVRLERQDESLISMMTSLS